MGAVSWRKATKEAVEGSLPASLFLQEQVQVGTFPLCPSCFLPSPSVRVTQERGRDRQTLTEVENGESRALNQSPPGHDWKTACPPTKSCHSSWVPAAEGSQGPCAAGLLLVTREPWTNAMKMELIPGPVPLSLGTHSLTQHIAPRCQFQEVCFPHHQDPRLPITFSFFIIKIPSRDRMSVTWSWHNNNLPMRL